MTGPVPFTSHPRRVVRGPDGTPSLVAIRRQRHRRGTVWSDPFVVVDQLTAFLRRRSIDRSWVVELFRDHDDDIGALPYREADQRWLVADRDAAVAGAEALCGHLRRGEPPTI